MSNTPRHLRAVDGTARTPITVAGLTVEVSLPYAAGHACTAAEAAALNQLRAENLRNNLSGRVKKALKSSPGKSAELETRLLAEFAAYESNYEFLARPPTKPKPDAIGREASKIARSTITEALRRAGTDPRSVAPEKMLEMIQALLGRRPDITEEATRRIAAAKGIGAEALAELAHGLGLTPPEPPPE